jgi:hypothetical protein
LKLVIATDYVGNIKAHHVHCYKNNQLILKWVDFISGNNLTRCIGDITVRLENSVVIWNKVYPLDLIVKP